MNIIKTIFVFIFLTGWFQLLARDGDQKPTNDTSRVEIRHLDRLKVDQLKTDPDMDYGRTASAVSLWERFKRWLAGMIGMLLEAAVTATWFSFLIIILVVVGIIYVIMRLLKVNAWAMFYDVKHKGPGYSTLDEDIHSMDFEHLIKKAIDRKEYRLAIRLVFLQSLKLLADNHHINWKPGKTNHDYLEELRAEHLKTGFNALNFYFEYAWYGNFSVTEPLFQKVDKLFTHWRTNL